MSVALAKSKGTLILCQRELTNGAGLRSCDWTLAPAYTNAYGLPRGTCETAVCKCKVHCSVPVPVCGSEPWFPVKSADRCKFCFVEHRAILTPFTFGHVSSVYVCELKVFFLLKQDTFMNSHSLMIFLCWRKPS